MPDTYKFDARQKDGKWQLILSYKDKRGRWHQKTKQGFVRKALALSDTEKQSLLSRIPPEDVLDASMADVTLAGFVDIFKEDQKGALTYNTLRNYDVMLQRVPDLKDIPMVKITFADVLHAVRTIEGMKASSINLTIQKLKALFSYASDVYHLFPISPIAKLPYLKEKTDGKVKVLTEKELATLLSSMEKEGPLYYTACCVAAYAGLRFGEICGLTPEDVDIFRATLHVKRQWGMVENGLYGFKVPKSNNSFRDIPIPPRLASILSEYIRHRVALDFNRRLFPLNESAYINRRIKKYAPTCSIHQLRHTYGTLLLAHGVDVKTVSALMGDRVETIMKTYIHYTDDMRNQARDNVSKIFG